jgi:hypothetical protein
MVQSVTPVSAMASSGGGAPDQLRRAVLARPGAGVDVGEQARGGLLACLATRSWCGRGWPAVGMSTGESGCSPAR